MKASVSDKVIFEELDGQVVLLDLNRGTYYKLNSSGSKIWALLKEHGDTSKVEDVIAAEYGIGRDQARRDVTQLVDDLEQTGLIIVDRS